MEPIVLLSHKWSTTVHIPLYLYLGGMAAGLFLVAAAADVLGGRWRWAGANARVAAYLAVPVILVAGLFLTFHLGKPERGMLFPLYFSNFGSWMTIGGWILGAYIPLTVALAAVWYVGVARRFRLILAILGAPVAVGLGMYTGMLLSGAGFVPLWDGAYLPYMFLASGVTTGLAASGLALLLARAVGWPPETRELAPDEATRGLRWLTLPVTLMIVVELVELYRFLSHLAGGPAGARIAYSYITADALAPWFWGGVVAVGLGLPLLLILLALVLRRWSVSLASVAFLCVVLGGALLRFVIVWGGEVKQPLIFPPQKWPLPGL